MEELNEQEFPFCSALAPAVVSLTPFTSSASPSSRRFSSCYTLRRQPVRTRRQLDWVSLQGRFVGAEEDATVEIFDRHTVFGNEEAATAAWRMFTPIQRVLVVAVSAVAAVNSKKNLEILKLQKSVEIRDQVLQSMQQRMDSLFHQAKCFDNQLEAANAADISVMKRRDCDCEPCQNHILPSQHALGNTPMEGLDGDKVLDCHVSVANVVEEAEERCMSDLSDWAPSVVSSVDNQFENGARVPDITSLTKNRKQNDAALSNLSAFIQSSEVYVSKRIAKLEDVIARKNTIINKLRKEMVILEQKVKNVPRVQRSSLFTKSIDVKPLPFMADNVLYDMDCTTGPSDSDNSPRNQRHPPAIGSQEIPVYIHKKSSTVTPKCSQFKSAAMDRSRKALMTSPLKESLMNRTPKSVPSLKPRHSPSGENRTRRRPPAVRSREATTQKRWL